MQGQPNAGWSVHSHACTVLDRVFQGVCRGSHVHSQCVSTRRPRQVVSVFVCLPASLAACTPDLLQPVQATDSQNMQPNCSILEPQLHLFQQLPACPMKSTPPHWMTKADISFFNTTHDYTPLARDPRHLSSHIFSGASPVQGAYCKRSS